MSTTTLNGVLPDYPADVTTPAILRDTHPGLLDTLRAWAEDDTQPMPEGITVQAQAFALADADAENDNRRWVRCCGGTSYALPYLEAVLAYKAARLARAVATEVPDVASLHRQIAELSQQKFDVEAQLALAVAQQEELRRERDSYEANYRQANSSLSVARVQHQDDIEKIGDYLLEEANRRNWCDEYDTLVQSLNSQLHIELKMREFDFTVTWTENYTVTVQRSTSVSAQNYDDAVELVRDGEYVGEADSDDIYRAVRNGEFEFNDDNGNFEAEKE